MRPYGSRFSLTGFCAMPIDLLSAVMLVDRERIEDLYREAYEQARATTSPPMTERYVPSLN